MSEAKQDSRTGSGAPFLTEHVWLPSELGDLELHVTQPGDPARLVGACVLLPPIGYAYMSTYQTARQLAEDLATQGIATVRMSYHGTGNSAGSGWEADRLAGWQHSVDVVVTALRSSTDLPVGLVGLQLGATLAMMSPQPRAFTVLWEPVTSGRKFVRSLRLLGQAAPEDSAFAGGLTHGGFPFPAGLQEELKELNPQMPKLGPVLIVLPPKEERLVAGAPEGAAQVTTLPAPVPSPLEQAAEDVEVPHATLTGIVSWVTAQVPTTSASSGRLDLQAAAGQRVTASGTAERYATFGELGLVGLWGEPPGASDVVVVFLNSGSEMNAGSGRSWVDYASRLNDAGIATVRLDWSGWGESPDRGHAPGRPNDRHCIPETAQVVRALTAAGRRVVLVGLCAGAWVALDVARTIPVAGVVALNPQMYVRRGDPYEGLITVTVERRTPMRKREAAGARWKMWTLLDLLGITNRAGRWLDELRASNSQILMLFAEGDEGLVYLRTRLARRVASTLASGRVRLVEVPEIDHSMHRSWQRDPLRSEIVDFVEMLVSS